MIFTPLAYSALEKASGRIIPWLFHYEDGRPVRSFKQSWRTACREAGLPGKLRHDFRRTAVRNLERAGVSRSVAMAMVGHRTEVIYRRYAICDSTMLEESARKLAAFHEAQQDTASKVEPLKARREGLKTSIA